jgi:hypothetical protein
VQPVPAPSGRLRRGRAGWLAAALALLAAGVVIALLASPAPAPATQSARSDLQVIGGKPLQQATCQEWLTGSPDERAAVLDALKASVGGGTRNGRATTLSDPAAYAVLDRACARPYARGFMLYIIYARAAAFQDTPQHFQ